MNDHYEDDENHPIPRVGTIDVETKLEGGGAYYGLVIAAPLKGDERSQKRLLKKLQNYIDDFHSPRFLTSSGKPNREKCRIYVSVHPDSDSKIFALLTKCRAWVEDNNITYVVDVKLPQDGGLRH